METQLEIDFKRWLRELASGVTVRYGRRFEANDGSCDDSDYCVDCVQKERWKRKHKKSEYIKIDGWDEAHETDSTPSCERCGCMIEFSPTNYFIREELKWLSEATEIDQWSAEILCRVLDNYDRKTQWPLVAPHAERLMRDAGLEIVPDGLIRYVPSTDDWYAFDTAWLAIYQHFAVKMRDWLKSASARQNGWCASKEIRAFRGAITSVESAKELVCNLIASVGQDGAAGEFLASIGLSCEDDLDHCILITDNRCDLPTFDVRGRILAESPNEFHPEAVVVTHAEMYFGANHEAWEYQLYYSDKHYDRTSWHVTIAQNGESLAQFCDNVRLWMDDILVPVGRDDRFRAHRLKQWDKVRDALEELFYFPIDRSERLERMTDAFMGVEGMVMTQHRVHVTSSVEDTLLRWVAKAAKG
jgi:hypothetical protein